MRAATARRLLDVLYAAPEWVDRLIPDSAYSALLTPIHAEEDRAAAAAYRESSERARLAWAAQIEAAGPGCPYCPNQDYETLPTTDAGDVYAECTACGATWFLHPCGNDPDDEETDRMTGWDHLSPEEQDDAADAYLVAEKEQMPEREEPDWDEPPVWPVYEPGEQVPAGTRVMWAHGRGIGGTVIPREETSELFSATEHPTRLAVLWDDGAEMVMDAGSLAPMTEDGPTPYPEPFVPSDDPEVPF